MLARRTRMTPRAPSHAERRASGDGYFAPGSVIRQVGNTPVTPFLGGGVAVLLQVAHPLVAAGVADHSGYGDDLWRRLVRTLRALYLITFGSRAEADRAAEAVQVVHASQLASETITVTEPAREIASVILHAPLPVPMRVLAPAHRLATAAQLPPESHPAGAR